MLLYIPRREPVIEVAVADLGEDRTSGSASGLYHRRHTVAAHGPLDIPPTSPRSTLSPIPTGPLPPSTRWVISASRGTRPRYLAMWLSTAGCSSPLRTRASSFSRQTFELVLRLWRKAQKGNAIELSLFGAQAERCCRIKIHESPPGPIPRLYQRVAIHVLPVGRSVRPCDQTKRWIMPSSPRPPDTARRTYSEMVLGCVVPKYGDAGCST